MNTSQQILVRKIQYEIKPNGAFIDWSRVFIKFDVKLDDRIVPDNYFASKVFDKVELCVNNKELNKANRSDLPYLTRYFTSKLNYSDSNLTQLGELEGYWSNLNPQSDVIIADDALDAEKPEFRRKNAVESTGANGIKYWTHQIIFPLDVGLSSLTKPLPKDCFFDIEFHLAKSCKAVMGLDVPVNDKIGDITGSLPLKILNPQLEVTFFYSDYFDGKLSPHRLSKVKWPFTMPTVHSKLLQDGLDIHQVRIAHGNIILFGINY